MKIIYCFISITFLLCQESQNLTLDNWMIERDSLSHTENTTQTYRTNFLSPTFNETIVGLYLPAYTGVSSVKLNDTTIYSSLTSHISTHSLVLPISTASFRQNNSLQIRSTGKQTDVLHALKRSKVSVYSPYFAQAFTEQLLVKMGIFLMLIVVSIAMFLGFSKDVSYIFLLLFACSELTEFYLSYRMYVGGIPIWIYSYLRELYTFLNLLHGLFLTLFLIFHLKIKPAKYVILACLALHGFTFFLGEGVNIYGNLCYALLITVYAWRTNRAISTVIIVGLLLFLLFAGLAHIELIRYGFSLGVLMFIISVIISIGYTIALKNEQLNLAQTQLAQSEAKLLRQSIQPHFILNTLLSIIAWIKKEPNTAIRQIEALAEEFSGIHDIADKKLIPLSKEIELCENYLELMSIRKDKSYSLKLLNLDLNKHIPPLIFHTLIENGLTHSSDKQKSSVFELEYQSDDQNDVYFIRNDGAKPSNGNINEGIGFAYIRQRLQECFPDRWSLNYQFINSFWSVRIDIKK